MTTRSRLAGLLMFATAMGWLEAVVVVYLRSMLGMQHGEAMPAYAEVMARIRSVPWLLPVEHGREAATMAMLASVAWLGGDRLRSRFGAFIMIFGIWDIAYYVGLRAMVGWPRSLAAMDLLFLIPPHPWWYQPVWLPVGISCVMIGTGLALMRAHRDTSGT
ncbi:MAG TPA: hypothetical protein VFQ05_16425 [Candidatus Eisenbacteria bacterium]|nr:hypothetical protein [Candidatus Eisenbacteria bacterium]